MATLLRKRNPNKHFRSVRLTPAEIVLAQTHGFTAQELREPMHTSRIAQLQEALGLAQKRPSVLAPVRQPVPAAVLAQASVEIVPREVFRPAVQPGGDWYRPYPEEISDEKLEALLQQAVVST